MQLGRDDEGSDGRTPSVALPVCARSTVGSEIATKRRAVAGTGIRCEREAYVRSFSSRRTEQYRQQQPLWTTSSWSDPFVDRTDRGAERGFGTCVALGVCFGSCTGQTLLRCVDQLPTHCSCTRILPQRLQGAGSRSSRWLAGVSTAASAAGGGRNSDSRYRPPNGRRPGTVRGAPTFGIGGIPDL
jgi:hypothetical protein